MEINSILGNYEPIDNNWLGLVEGDEETMVRLRSSQKWADEYLKISKKYESGSIKEQNIKTVAGSSRRIRKINANETTEMTPEQEEQFYTEIRDFMIDNVIIDWKGIEENGEALPYTRENALRVFDIKNAGAKLLIFNIMRAAMNGDNFTKSSEYILEDEESVKK